MNDAANRALEHLEKAREHAKAGIEAANRAKLAIVRFWMVAEDTKGLFRR
jgi:hypothetical protein